MDRFENIMLKKKENIMLNEINQTQKDAYHMIPLI